MYHSWEWYLRISKLWVNKVFREQRPTNFLNKICLKNNKMILCIYMNNIFFWKWKQLAFIFQVLNDVAHEVLFFRFIFHFISLLLLLFYLLLNGFYLACLVSVHFEFFSIIFTFLISRIFIKEKLRFIYLKFEWY